MTMREVSEDHLMLEVIQSLELMYLFILKFLTDEQ
jgi:hypothetical protein